MRDFNLLKIVEVEIEVEDERKFFHNHLFKNDTHFEKIIFLKKKLTCLLAELSEWTRAIILVFSPFYSREMLMGHADRVGLMPELKLIWLKNAIF